MKRQCRCSPRQIEQYRQRISGPLLDRIDIHCEVPLVDFRELSQVTATGEKSEIIRERVVAARHIQHERFRKSANATNSSMSPRQMKAHCRIDAEATDHIQTTLDFLLSQTPYLENLATERANALLADHRRVREAARDVGSYEVTPCLPVDVLGVYVLLPASL